MRILKALSAALLLVGAGILVGFAAATQDGIAVDGRVGSMTPQHLQRAIAHLGLDARSFSYETTKPHVLKVQMEDYVDGKLDKTELLSRNEVPHIGKQSFMLFSDSRDAEHLVLSSPFISASGNSESANAWVKKPKPSWGITWNEKAMLNVGVKAALYYCINQGGKGLSYPLAPVDKLVALYPRVIVVTATLESEGSK